jgi:hypothetical protein
MPQIREVPMWLLGGVVVLAGLGFLTWHGYARDPDDEAWLDPGQPPAQVALGLVPAHGAGSPMSCNTGFRSRCYPDVMAAASLMARGEA